MGYYNQPAAARPPERPTEQQAAIMAVKSTDSLAVIEKLVYNVVVAPRDEKFRRVKLSNPKINAAIVQAEGALGAMQALGWVASEEDADMLVLPAGVNYTMKDQVVFIQEHSQRLAKEADRQQRLQAVSRSVSNIVA